tara:strand:+ start:43 stop:339 length:297 start_codon:yes stop_codon:yes gene_type:complete
MNISVKNVYFAKWLNRKIGSKDRFLRRFEWKSREIKRWCQGQNFPKAPILPQLLYDLHLYTGQEYTSLISEAHEALLKDYKEYKHGQKEVRESFRQEE